jgi:glutamyl-tRNA synthetase
MAEITTPARVRIAPSPTGYMHIGNVRTALFNWLVARQTGGQFLVRIEDTDEKRFIEGAADAALESLRWVGLDWDEGPDIGGPHAPYVQSERLRAGIYQPFVDQLLATGRAYKCFVTPEEEDAMRAEAAARGVKSFRFRGPERDWTLDQMNEAEAQGKPFTIRLKVPLEGATSFRDLIRGGDEISFDNTTLYDPVLIKSSGMIAYNLAHLVDDHLMGITHVIRGEDWVPTTPYHIILYGALGWEPPIFAHVPNIWKQDGRGKLSKRKDDVATNRFWEQGYLPEAMFNYLALQGWSYDDHTEIMSRDELVERFSLSRVQASPARWNPDKLLDMNGIYIRKLSTDELAEKLLPFLARAGYIDEPASDDQRAYVRRLTPLIHERLKFLAEAPDLLAFFFTDLRYDDPSLLVPKKMDAAATKIALERVHARLSALDAWVEPQLEEELRALAEELGLKPGPLFGAIRVAVTGRTVAPPLFETLAALGQERTIARLKAAIGAL